MTSGMKGCRLESNGGITELILTGRQRGNPITPDLVDELLTALSAIPAAARVLLIRSEDKDFCVGGDINGFAASQDLTAHLQQLIGGFHRVVGRIAQLPIPTVGLLRGWTAGGGIALAASCDIVVAAESARFRTGYAALALTADGGTAWHLARTFGAHRALDLLLLNEPFEAAEALHAGLISRVVPESALDAEGQRITQALTARAPESSSAVKQLVTEASSRTLRDHLLFEEESMLQASRSSNAREGIAAFLERRSPVFGVDEE